jgi:hypothetical protein
MLRSTAEDAVPTSVPLEQWLLRLVGIPETTTYTCHHSTTKWEWVDIVGQLLIWNPTPEIANQAISHFLDY